jgi:hypothetical protein
MGVSAGNSCLFLVNCQRKRASVRVWRPAGPAAENRLAAG